MHAVPKPTNRWFLSEEEENELIDEEQNDDMMWDDEDERKVERSVILFNTWSEQGPRGVTEDYTKGAMPDGIELDDDSDVSYMEQQRAQRLEEWQEDYGEQYHKLWCRSRTRWEEVGVDDNDLPADAALRVSLMGKRTRRLFPYQHVQLFGPSTLRDALEEDSQPSQFHLVHKSKYCP
jgi:predicted DsbA family dithiol-disulfide isomerase